MENPPWPHSVARSFSTQTSEISALPFAALTSLPSLSATSSAHSASQDFSAGSTRFAAAPGEAASRSEATNASTGPARGFSRSAPNAPEPSLNEPLSENAMTGASLVSPEVTTKPPPLRLTAW